MKKTEMYWGIGAYISSLNKGGKGRRFTRDEKRTIWKSLQIAMRMLDSLPNNELEQKDLANGIANFLAYIVSNGKGTYAEKVIHLSDIVSRTNLILKAVDQTPVAEVMDYVKKKKTNALKEIFELSIKNMK